MLKQSALYLFLLISGTNFNYAQEPESILSSPDDWKSELIIFPLGFAPSIDFEGIEDLRFRPQWSDSSSVEFWTYTFVWYIDSNFVCNEKNLSEVLNMYYDGLMGIDEKNKKREEKLKKTKSFILKNNNAYEGLIQTYDAFFTKKNIELNVKVKEAYCTKSNKQLFVFELSPKAYENEIWEKFSEIKLKISCE